MSESKNPTAAEIWKRLSEVDVSDKVQQKGGLTYLSWAWAWGEMMDRYPQMTLEWSRWQYQDGVPSDVLIYNGGTCSVECTVTIGDVSRTAWLPVMDYKNNAITNPDARAINDAKMRCLTKCFALFGLGHYIYAGEDLPTGSDAAKAKTASEELQRLATAAKTKGIELDQSYKDRARTAITQGNLEELSSLIEETKLMIQDHGA